MSEFPLGPFLVQAPLGQGGMAQVWRGVHTLTGLPVAIKVLPARQGRGGTRLQRAFRVEVRQTARLDHPGIVMVLDHGVIPPEVAVASGGVLTDGSPYLVMELAPGGSLDASPPSRDWATVEALLSEVLDALAWAHARGVLHRDLKPANILRFPGTDGRVRLKLADFGLAHAWCGSAVDGGPLAGGTPGFMPPEQIRGEWRDQGPWTDLYALGCLCWWSATGTAPVQGANVHDQLRAVVERPAPTLALPPGWPPSVVEWVARLLDRDPAARYRLAADAAADLRDLRHRTRDAPRRPPGNTWSNLTAFDEDGDLPSVEPMPWSGTWSDAGEPAAPAVPAWPGRSAPPPPPTPVLVGAGLGLFGLREPALVDRVDQRAALWAALEDVTTSGRPRVVLLRGLAGVGKTRLAMGLAERAHAAGLAEYMRADHAPVPFATQGVVPMLARYLRCEGLDGPGLLRRLDERVRCGDLADATMAAATARLVLAGEPGGPMPFRSVHDRYDAIGRLLGHLGSRRPLVLIIDDAQWGDDALGFAAWLLTRRPQERLPVLVVLAFRDDELRARPEAASMVAELAAHADARTVLVGPLAPADHQELVACFLPLHPDLARRVAGRTAGNPLFAERLVGDWVRRGLLRSTPEGFKVTAGSEEALPDDLHEMWRWSLQLVLSAQPPDAAPALWIAAALGVQVDEEEWARACAALSVTLPAGLVDALIKAGVAVPSAGGWAFQHGMARESLRRDAEERGVWPRVHAACAAALDADREPERVGLHHLQAGEAERALALLVVAAERLSATCAPREALAVLQRVDEAVERLALPATDRRLTASWRPRFAALLTLGQFPAADQHAARCAQTARRHGWTEEEADAFRWRGMVAEKRGDLLTAEAMFDRGREVAEAGGHDRALAACLEHQGTLLRQRGDRAGSLDALERARAIYEALGFQLGLADCLKEIGGTHAALSAPQEAVEPLRVAEGIYVALGHDTGRAYCLNNLGEVLRRQGDLDGAERAYAEALAAMERTGVHARIVPLLNLGLVRIARGDPARARATLDQALKLALVERRRVMAAYCHGFLLPCLAAAGDWAQVQRHLDEARGLLEETGLVDADLASCARRAAEQARAAGASGLSQALQGLASDQEQRLGGAGAT